MCMMLLLKSGDNSRFLLLYLNVEQGQPSVLFFCQGGEFVDLVLLASIRHEIEPGSDNNERVSGR